MKLKLLILDLDETLIYAQEKSLEREADFYTEFYCVYKRPYLQEFLQFCSEYYQVAAGLRQEKSLLKK
ncbi:MAG: NIF family HAD-type phosphatase [Cyanobacteria bacterium P01_E01_bin.35]